MNWSGQMPELMEHLGQLGVNFMVRFDAERFLAGGGPWTVVVSGGPLSDAAFRQDDRDLERCLTKATDEIRLRLGDDALPQ